MFDLLTSLGYQIKCTAHAEAILAVDFPSASDELESALAKATIPIEEIVASGGGEAKGTQRLRHAFTELGWRKGVFTVQKIINGKETESQSHEIDHVKTFENDKTIAMEIEWNNKDPFYDRDLENFKRLHGDGAISMGIIITRGRSLQDDMHDLVHRFLNENSINALEDLEKWGYIPTPRQKKFLIKQTTRTKAPLSFRDAFARKFVGDKFGEATTHWRKLEDRIHRGVGNPCPMIFIGMPSSIVVFGEGVAALVEVAPGEPDEEDGAEA